VDSKTVAVSGINIDKVEGIETNRLVSFVNHFLITSVNFLNDFTQKCESKLEIINCQINQIDSQLRILESKLSSLPAASGSIDSASNNSSSTLSVSVSEPQSQPVPKVPRIENPTDSSTSGNEPKSLKSIDSHLTAPGTEEEDKVDQENPSYAKFYKMLAVGVPVLAVKQKMTQEGIDPSVLDKHLQQRA